MMAVTFLGILVLFIPIASAAPKSKITAEKRFQEYTAVTYYNEQALEGRFEIVKSGKRLYQKTGGKFEIGTRLVEEDVPNPLTEMGKDITGNGIPNLVIYEWTGGAHCCSNFYVFEIGPQFRFLARIDAGHGDLSHFADLDGDRNLEFVGTDWTFAYWWTSFAESPAPEIILRFTAVKYRLAENLMRKPAPSEAELNREIEVIRNDESWKDMQRPPATLWGEMLDLIYSGNSAAAWRFFGKAWLAGVPGKDTALGDFKDQLAKSPYWPQIQHLNLGRK